MDLYSSPLLHGLDSTTLSIYSKKFSTSSSPIVVQIATMLVKPHKDLLQHLQSVAVREDPLDPVHDTITHQLIVFGFLPQERDTDLHFWTHTVHRLRGLRTEVGVAKKAPRRGS